MLQVEGEATPAFYHLWHDEKQQKFNESILDQVLCLYLHEFSSCSQ